MKIHLSGDAKYLPKGKLVIEKGSARYPVVIEDSYSVKAAQAVLDHGVVRSFSTQAEVIAEAINCFRWDLGGADYHATVIPGGRSRAKA